MSWEEILRVQDFLTEVTDVCRRHGYWLSGGADFSVEDDKNNWLAGPVWYDHEGNSYTYTKIRGVD